MLSSISSISSICRASGNSKLFLGVANACEAPAPFPGAPEIVQAFTKCLNAKLGNGGKCLEKVEFLNSWDLSGRVTLRDPPVPDFPRFCLRRFGLRRRRRRHMAAAAATAAAPASTALDDAATRPGTPAPGSSPDALIIFFSLNSIHEVRSFGAFDVLN